MKKLLLRFDELTDEAVEYHLRQIEEKMEEVFNKGELEIVYQFPEILIENEIFREKIDYEMYKVGWNIEFLKDIECGEDEETGKIKKLQEFRISCIEIIEE